MECEQAWLSQKLFSVKGEARYPEEMFNWSILSGAVFTPMHSYGPQLPVTVITVTMTSYPLASYSQNLWHCSSSYRTQGYGSKPRRTLTVTRTTNCLRSGSTAALTGLTEAAGTTESRPRFLNVHNTLNQGPHS